MLFGRTETPKGIGTLASLPALELRPFGRTETPKGIGTFLLINPNHKRIAVWKSRTPKGD